MDYLSCGSWLAQYFVNEDDETEKIDKWDPKYWADYGKPTTQGIHPCDYPDDL